MPQNDLISALKRIIAENSAPLGRAQEYHADPEKAALAKALLECCKLFDLDLRPLESARSALAKLEETLIDERTDATGGIVL